MRQISNFFFCAFGGKKSTNDLADIEICIYRIHSKPFSKHSQEKLPEKKILGSTWSERPKIGRSSLCLALHGISFLSGTKESEKSTDTKFLFVVLGFGCLPQLKDFRIRCIPCQ
jgi:hypothetical protein